MPGRGRTSTGRDRALARAFRATDSYGLVLALILLTYAFIVSLPEGKESRALILAMQAAMMWFALRTSQVPRRLQRVATTVLIATLMLVVSSLFLPDSPKLVGALAIVSDILLLAAPFAIVRHLLTRPIIDGQTLMGALAAYLLIGMFFAAVYLAVGALQPGPFFTSGDGSYANDLFFSFTTLTTTGYGNLIPTENPGQTLAVLEMLTGQLFLIVAVGRIVSLLGVRRASPSSDVRSGQRGGA